MKKKNTTSLEKKHLDSFRNVPVSKKLNPN